MQRAVLDNGLLWVMEVDDVYPSGACLSGCAGHHS